MIFAAKKYYSIPDGIYEGDWSNKMVWLIENGIVIERIDVKDRSIRRQSVIVEVLFPKIIVYTKSEYHERTRNVRKT